jgi:type I restriction enzyme, S subunit
MSKEKLIPDLRFPEFKNEGEWTETILGSVVEMKGRIGYRGYTTEDIVDKGKGAITLSPSNFKENGQLNFDKCTYISWAKYDESPEIQLEEGQTVLVKTASVGKTAYVNKLPEKATVNPQIVVLKPKAIHNRFLSFTVSHQNTQKQIRNNVGAGAIPNISQEIISKTKILLPPDKEKKEQQKIASCLSSLDEVIAAHSQKLELLKDHKKGLMQNLFPSAGEKVPKYRFKEFEKDGEWEEKKLGELTNKVGSGTTPLGGESTYKKVGRPFVRSQNVSWGVFLLENIAFIDEETHKNSINTEIQYGDVLLNITGASIGRSAVANEFVTGGNVNQHVCIIRAEKDILNPYFINHFLISDFGQKQIASFQAGGNRQGLNFVQIRSLYISIPPSLQEQQKIASCLSSLDALITAQAEKIAQLKVHKKGLMQGLFPKSITN